MSYEEVCCTILLLVDYNHPIRIGILELVRLLSPWFWFCSKIYLNSILYISICIEKGLIPGSGFQARVLGIGLQFSGFQVVRQRYNGERQRGWGMGMQIIWRKGSH